LKSASASIQATAICWGLVTLLSACQPSFPTNTSSPAAAQPDTVKQQVSDKDGMVIIYVPAGEFLMGSLETDPIADSDEKPQHRIYLDAFWIDQTEVTNAMYAKCVKAGACQPPSSTASYTFHAYYGDPQYDHYPVAWITWE